MQLQMLSIDIYHEMIIFLDRTYKMNAECKNCVRQ